jgi:hypothetical protein
MQNNNKKRNITERITNLNQEINSISQQLIQQQDLDQKLALQQTIDSRRAQITELHVTLAGLDQQEIAAVQEKIQGTTRFRI